MADSCTTVFVTATDTGAGKTAVTALLLGRLLAAGIEAVALKPVASGRQADGINEDVGTLLHAAGKSTAEADDINLYSFGMPAAPSIAAAAEGRAIDPGKLTAWCRQRCQHTRVCLIEGVGGLMVPLTPSFLVRDWLGAMPEAEVLLVVPARLGAINHALLTLAELSRLDRVPRWLVISDSIGGQQSMAAQIAGVLQLHLVPDTTVFTLSYMGNGNMDDPIVRGFADSWLHDLDLRDQGV